MSFLHRGGETQVERCCQPASPQNLFLAFICSGFFLAQEIQRVRLRLREEREGGREKKSLNHFVSFDFDEFLADLPLH